MSAEDRLVKAMKAGWVTRDQVCAILSLEKDRDGRDAVTHLKKENPVVFGLPGKPGYHIAARKRDELADIERCIYHYRNMIMDMSQSMEQLERQREFILEESNDVHDS